MDIVLDTAGERMFYRGTAMIPRGFHSRESFPLRIQLSSWGNPPANETSRKAAVILSDQFDERGRFLVRAFPTFIPNPHHLFSSSPLHC